MASSVRHWKCPTTKDVIEGTFADKDLENEYESEAEKETEAEE